ncbi:hypothetical protein MMC12_006835 [Toensbergia leucococca]|nr:hypothetical protein [Toensbergia leucococca]
MDNKLYQVGSGASCKKVTTGQIPYLAWHKDLLMRNIKRSIEFRLDNGWVFVLQKLPPAEYWAKRTRCGLDPYCSSPNRTPEASSYRLILESKRSLMLSKIPIDAIEGWERLQQDARSTTILCTKIQASPQTKTTYTKKIDVATPYCLECIEKLWDGHGMVHEASTLTPSSSLTAILSSLYPETRADPNRSGTAFAWQITQSGKGKFYLSDEARALKGTMVVGGATAEISTVEAQDKKLSEILKYIDDIVEEELMLMLSSNRDTMEK